MNALLVRADGEDRVLVDSLVRAHGAGAVSPHVNDRVVAHDRDRETGDFPVPHGGRDVIVEAGKWAALGVGRSQGRRDKRDNEQEEAAHGPKCSQGRQ